MSYVIYFPEIEAPPVGAGKADERSPACTKEEARKLLYLLRNEYRLLSPENRSGVKALLLAFAHNVPNMRSKFSGSDE